MNIFPSVTEKGPVALQPLESKGVRGIHCYAVGYAVTGRIADTCGLF